MDVAAPWGVTLGCSADPRFYLITRGECWFEAPPAEAVRLVTGDILLVDGSTSYSFSHEPGADLIPLDRILQKVAVTSGMLKLGGGGRRTAIVCGTHRGPATKLGLARRNATVLPASARSASWDQIVCAVDADVGSGVQETMAIAAQLTGILIESHYANRQHRKQMQEPDRLVPVLARIHEQPCHDWTVDRLARIAGMSRSGFCARFTALVGEAPARYLQRCRLALAAGFLEKGDARLNQIADWTGYHSDVALSKAFKKRFGVSPGGYRKAVRISGQTSAIAS